MTLGWVDQCNNRGTIDIIWSCISTLFICLWIMIHLNIPARHEGRWDSFVRKLRWLVQAALATETLLLSSGGQWASAKRSRAAMRALGHHHWTMVHGFYADMGGFLLQSPRYPPFPVTAKQIHYLVEKGYINIPTITEKEIFDKSKADHFTKTVACLQTGWFVTQCIARACQHLSVSPLELLTCAIILCTVTTYFFWLQKPLDVLTPTYIAIDISMAQILIDAGPKAEKPFRNTPMDFAEPQAYTLDQWPQLARSFGPHRHPLQRSPNDRNPQLYSLTQRMYLGMVVFVFSTSSFLAWNFNFSSREERIIWRTACVISEASLFNHGLLELRNFQKSRNHSLYVEGYKAKWPWTLFFFVPGTLYFCARSLMIAMAFSSLRALPADSYVQVQWSSFIPHI